MPVVTQTVHAVTAEAAGEPFEERKYVLAMHEDQGAPRLPSKPVRASDSVHCLPRKE